MNFVFLALGIAFFAIGMSMLAGVKSAANAIAAKNKRLSGILFFIAAALFVFAGALPMITD
jgi:hypothetical protein